MLYNSLSALPLTLLGAAVMGEVPYTMSFEHAANPQFWVSVVLASFAGVFITYIVFLCTTVNGPLVTSITGNAKDIVQTVLGALLFHDFVPTLQVRVGAQGAQRSGAPRGTEGGVRHSHPSPTICHATHQNVTGILVSFCGAGLFSYVKLSEALVVSSKELAKKADAATAPLSPAPLGGGGGEMKASGGSLEEEEESRGGP